jgi:hypothetical protein
VEELLVVVQVETVEVRTLAAAGLRNPKNLPAPHFQRLSRPGLNDELVK